MNQQLSDQDPLVQAMEDYYKRNDITKALKKIDAYLAINPKFIPFPYQFKSDIFRNQGKIDDALSILNTGLINFPSSHDLLKRRAEILGLYKGDFQTALQDIGNAIIFFEGNSHEQIAFFKKLNIKENLNFYKNYTTTKVDLKILEQELNRLNGLKFLNVKIDKVEEDLVRRLEKNEKEAERERFRNIELLGIFTAILGFIFANVQKSALIDKFSDLLLFDLALLIPLAIFIFLIYKITR